MAVTSSTVRRERNWTGRISAWALFLLTVGGIAATVLRQAQSLAIESERPRLLDTRLPGGSLVIAGGGTVPAAVRERFVELAGGPNARIVVIPASEPRPGDSERWLAPWKSCGALAVEICHAPDRAAAHDPGFLACLEQATGVWFGGGSQALLAERYVDTAVERCLRELLERNGAIGGNSAGAAILSRVMIAEGYDAPVEARGLGLMPHAIVDQHFLRRNRFWRLQQMLQRHPDLVGLGVDEQTALVVRVRGRQLSVVGDSYVLACLPGSEGTPARVEVLRPGDNVSLDLLRREHLPYRPEFDWDEAMAGR